MEETLFTKIITGQIPSHKIYEDDLTYAFLDIDPTTPGHTLVIPKVPVELVWDLDDEYYQAVMKTAQKVAKRLQEVLNVKFVGQKIIGTDVPHAHVHVFGLSTPDQTYDNLPAETKGKDNDSLAAMAEKLRF